ncbi:xyloglucan:xyloglucosyl transferase [Sarracenia purpurea var. burkii]
MSNVAPISVGSVVSTGDFNKDFFVTWSPNHVNTSGDGRTRSLKLDNDSGSGFASNDMFLFGQFDMQIKLITVRVATIDIGFDGGGAAYRWWCGNHMIDACVWNGNPSRRFCSTADSAANWWNEDRFGSLTSAQRRLFKWVRKYHLIYDYCRDNQSCDEISLLELVLLLDISARESGSVRRTVTGDLISQEQCIGGKEDDDE